MEIADTLPKVFLQQYHKYGDKKIAVVQKDFGIWKPYTWQEQYEIVKYFALGLVSLGLKPGGKVAIVGDSDRHWYWSRWAVMAAGSVVVGMFADSIPEELKYIAEHSESSFCIADDQEQVDKMLEIRDELPQLQKIIYWDPKGLAHYNDPMLIDYYQVVELGKKYEKEHPEAFEELVNNGKPDDAALFIYTSGTSGTPKGAIITHKSMLTGCRGELRVEPFYDTDRFFASPVPAWIAGPLFAVYALLSGCTMFYPEEPETVQEDSREISPEIVYYGARFWESLASMVLAKISDATYLKKSLYNTFLPVGYKIAQYEMENRNPSLFWKALNSLANVLVFRPLRDKVGFSRLRAGMTIGAVTSPDAFRFFHAVGINLKNSFGLTEAAPVTAHRTDIRFDSIGPVIPGFQLRIADDGEILIRGDGVFHGYYKMPEVTAEALADGWFHTGDAGHIDENDGHLIYLDRVKELGELAGGYKYAPQYIESRLRFSPYIKDAMTLGGKDREHVTALINIDFDNCGRWAEANRINYTTFTDLSQKPEIIDLVRKDIERVNRSLPRYSRIKTFANLHKELDADEAELTRTRKLRRGFLEERYGGLIGAINNNQPEFAAEAQITYRDGRKGTIKTQVTINSVDIGE